MRLLHLKLMKFWIVVLLFFIPSHSFAQRWRYCLLVAPESYPLRWGEREPPNADMVAMPPGLDTSRTIPTSPRCYKVGKSGFWLSYSVEDAGLVGGLFVVVWDEITGETVWQRYYYPVWREGVVSLDGLVLPSYITVLGFQVVWLGWLGYGSMFTRFTIFVVLDEPKEPMNPAWVSVLRISCQWARGESTVEGAAIALTQKLWENGHYNGGNPGYTHYFRDANGLPIDDRERFYLKAFLEDPWFPYGQCNDFADFLVCLMISVGVPIDKARRTHQLLLTDDTNFRTNWITPAGQAPTKAEWTYHQFVFTDRVWDGCLTLGEYGNFVVGMNFDSYKTGLVEAILRYDWQSAPPAGWFIPEVSAISANQMPPWPWAN
jgi:hypothetical protein